MNERVPDGIPRDLIDRDEVSVMCLHAADEPEGIRHVWEDLEQRIGDMRGRKFLGVFNIGTSDYRACTEIQDGDVPAELGLESATLPGGKYLRARLRGQPPGVYELIGPTFEVLVKAAVPDDTRPSIEFYRRRDQIDLLLPVKA